MKIQRRKLKMKMNAQTDPLKIRRKRSKRCSEFKDDQYIATTRVEHKKRSEHKRQTRDRKVQQSFTAYSSSLEMGGVPLNLERNAQEKGIIQENIWKKSNGTPRHWRGAAAHLTLSFPPGRALDRGLLPTGFAGEVTPPSGRDCYDSTRTQRMPILNPQGSTSDQRPWGRSLCLVLWRHSVAWCKMLAAPSREVQSQDVKKKKDGRTLDTHPGHLLTGFTPACRRPKGRRPPRRPNSFPLARPLPGTGPLGSDLRSPYPRSKVLQRSSVRADSIMWSVRRYNTPNLSA
ncbi:hypothetical protein Cgig2_028740 [Carnegiea gigantea]|uniref:Uncharacterized protein n=1 Tax=Carnegiea gigantea TaxID=171969 RepID=A0A9Q1JGL1_9CARY|nr:hypothetical protein Cgig2_028740 [Carnegiea gigantea]